MSSRKKAVKKDAAEGSTGKSSKKRQRQIKVRIVIVIRIKAFT